MTSAHPLRILHVDMDAFYAAVEVRDEPSLRGKPVIVGGSPDSRGVVCSATYEARAFGVRAAMPLAQARRLCPAAVFVPGRMERYAEVADDLRRIFHSFTPLVEPLSLDEAFLDVAGTERLFGDALAVGREIKHRVRTELELVASVGISHNKFLAKLASDLGKPDGFVVIGPAEVDTVLPPLPVDRLWGVGPTTAAELGRLGLRTIGDVRRAGALFLRARLGALGDHLDALAHGRDDRRVEPHGEAKSIGAERTFERDLHETADLERELLAIAEEVGTRVRAARVSGRTVQLKVRYHDFRTITRRRTLAAATDVTREIYEAAAALLHERVPLARARIRLLGIQLSHLGEPDAAQPLLFGEDERRRERRLDRTVDDLRERLGRDSVRRARALGDEPSRDP